MEWAVIGGFIVYLVQQQKTASGPVMPPVGGVNVPSYHAKPKAPKNRIYRLDTMAETLDKGLNMEAYRNAVHVHNGASSHYHDVARREGEKKIHNFADLYNDYVAQVDKKHELAGHIWKQGKISFGYPTRANSAGPIPWMITPYIPKPSGHPLTQNTASLFKIWSGFCK